MSPAFVRFVRQLPLEKSQNLVQDFEREFRAEAESMEVQPTPTLAFRWPWGVW